MHDEEGSSIGDSMRASDAAAAPEAETDEPELQEAGSDIGSVLLVTGLVAGGVGRHVAQLASGLSERGITVGVACPDVVASRFDLRSMAEVYPVEIGARPQPLRDRTAVHTLRGAIAEHDVVHAHGLRAGSLTAVASASKGERTAPLLVTTHNAAPQGRLAAVVHHGLERVVCRNADVVLGVSQDLMRRAEEGGAEVVERAVVPASWAVPLRGSEQVRAELDVPDGSALVVSVGRLAAQKGFDRLLDVLVEMLDGAEAHDPPRTDGSRPRGFRLVVAGDGPQREHLQRGIDRYHLPVRLLGHRDDVADLLGAADVAVSSARWEGQPVWIQEALSVGTPIIATDVGGTAEVVGSGGVLVDPDQPGVFAAELRRAIDDPQYRTELSARAAARAAELPDGAAAVAAAIDIYGRAVARVRRRRVD